MLGQCKKCRCLAARVLFKQQSSIKTIKSDVCRTNPPTIRSHQQDTKSARLESFVYLNFITIALETITLLDEADCKNFIYRVDLTVDCEGKESIFNLAKIMDDARVIVPSSVGLNTNHSVIVVLQVFIEWNEELAVICKGAFKFLPQRWRPFR